VAPLRLAAALIGIALVMPAQTQTVALWKPYITEASLRFGIPEEWIERVMRAESAGQTMQDGRPIRSRAGAMGLMQLMPATWYAMRQRLGLGSNPDDPRDNVLAGTFYLRLMYERFGYPGLFGAYNAGPARYSAHIATGKVLPTETVAYLTEVASVPSNSGIARTIATPDSLFLIRRKQEVATSSYKRTASLFAVKNDAP